MKPKCSLRLFVALMLMACLTLTGCNSNPATATSTDSPPKEEYHNATTITDNDETDPLAALLVTEEEAKSSDGIYLLRDNKLYTLNRSKPGYVEPSDTVGTASLQSGVIDLYGMSVTNHKDILSLGDIEPPTLEPDDKIVSYSSQSVLRLYLARYDFIGYTVPIINSTGGGNYRIPVLGSAYGMAAEIEKPDNANVAITDSCNVEVAENDWYNLNHDETYTISWYIGTNYQETTREANCRYYQLSDEYFVDPIDGTLTKNGYAEYELPELQPGYYTLLDWGIIKIE